MSKLMTLEELKKRAKDGDLEALQELRHRGFFQKKKSAQEYAASHEQQRLWILDRMNAASSAYNMPEAWRLEGKLNASVLQKAFEALIQRHESLRTTFKEYDGKVLQVIHDNISFQLQKIDLSQNLQSLEKAQELVFQEAAAPFDLGAGPLIRAILLKRAENRWIFLFNIHHIVSDEWSLGVLLRELSFFYESFLQNKNDSLPPLKIQYKDYSAWRNKMLQGETAEKLRRYWKNRLNVAPVLNLLPDTPRPAIQTFTGKTISFFIDDALAEEIKALGRKSGASLFMTIAAWLNILLFRYTNQEDIIIGVPEAGRDHPDLENVVGFFVNTLALRNEIHGNDHFVDVLKKVQQILTEAIEHRMLPFDETVKELYLERDRSRSPLFDVMLALQNADASDFHFGGLRAVPFECVFTPAKFDLTFQFLEKAHGLELGINYNTDLFREDSIRRMANCLIHLAESIVHHPEKPIRNLELLSIDEKQRIIINFNQTAADYPLDKTVAQIFEEKAAQQPEHPAVFFKDAQWTYRELNEYANGLACVLLEQCALQPEECVGVLLERSPWAATSFLGILKAGGAYVPIDPSYPLPRIEFMLRDSGCRTVLSEAKIVDSIAPRLPGIRFIDIESSAARMAANPQTTYGGRRLACVIFTSGSTGRPKGTLIEHRSIVRMVLNTNYMRLTDADVFTQTGSLAFDASTLEIWGALLNGAGLCTIDVETLSDAVQLRRLIERRRITAMFLTTSLFNQFVDTDIRLFQDIKKVLTGGEKASFRHFDKLQKTYPSLVLVNLYGPTENTTLTTFYNFDNSVNDNVPIGAPIANSTIYILDSAGQLAPIGVAGEICTGGEGVARGYLNHPSFTAEKFTPDPFQSGERLYRTGDLGRWLPDGNIEFLGRIDRQVKIRGYRIETAEIENRLLQWDAVKEALVIAKDFGGPSLELAAYIVSDEEIGGEALRRHLQNALPAYMIPSYFTRLERFPLTPNGKIDEKALPDPIEAGVEGRTNYAAPRNETEAKLAAIWREALNAERAGIHDNFFEAGGHSLKAVLLASRIQQQFQVKITLREVFLYPTIAALAEIVQRQKTSIDLSIEPIPSAEHYALSHAQRRLWTIDRMGANPAAYNIPAIYELKGNLDIAALEPALQALIDRHESLRTSFAFINDEPRQRIHSRIDFRLEKIDILRPASRHVISRERSNREIFNPREDGFLAIARNDRVAARQSRSLEDLLNERIVNEASSPFDLEKGPLFRAILFRLKEDNHALFLNLHHIVSDGWSMKILIGELLQLYSSFSQGKPNPLPPLRIQYKDYAAWQNRILSSQDAVAHREYWHRQFEDVPLLDLPTDNPHPAVQTFAGAAYRFVLDSSVYQQLKEFGRYHGASAFMTLLSLLNILLHRYTEQEEIVIGVPAAGRGGADLENQVGFFVNMLALRNKISAENSFIRVLENVRDAVAEAFEHQIYPFDRLVEELYLKRDMGRNPLFDVAAAMHNRSRSLSIISGLETTPLDIPASISKFDLSFFFTEMENESCGIGIEYNTDLFAPERIERMAQHFLELIHSAVQSPDQPVKYLNILPPWERRSVIETFNACPSDYPRHQTIAALFEAQAEKSLHRPAVAFGEKTLSYSELNGRANRLAHLLLDDYALQQGECIGVLLDRCEMTAAVLLGILKAGGAYVPIDPAYPPSRMAFILRDAACRVVLTEEKYLARLRSQNYEMDLIDVWPYAEASAPNPLPQGTPSNLAYVIYTSGSTGTPKGSLIDQRAVLRLVLQTNYIRIQADDRIAQTGSLAFDASTYEFWGSLLNGACICLPDGDSLLEPVEFRQFMDRHRITVMFLTTSLFNQYVEADIGLFQGLRVLLTGGETASARHFNQMRKAYPNLSLVHVYGPTENTTFTTYFPVTTNQERGVPIGAPIANTVVYILDRYGQPAPIGVAGEIAIGGEGLAWGYLNQSAMTAEKFVPHPFLKGERLYRSGDRGVWREDGQIVFLGRIDQQVKVRGFRVEMEEIENSLLSHGAIKEAAVIARDTLAGTKELAVYYSSDGELSAAELRSFLSQSLPEYMIPAYFTWLEKLPLTVNGKVDKRRLPAPPAAVGDSIAACEEPRNDREAILARVWQTLLSRESIGIHDNYFELGGDSIRAIQTISRLRQAGWRLEVRDIFQNQTIAKIAPLLRNEKRMARRESVSGPVPLTPIQRWFFETIHGDIHHFNQSILLRSKDRLDENALRAVLDKLQQHHDALRLTYRFANGDIEQNIAEIPYPLDFSIVDYREYSDAASHLASHADGIQHRIDLEKGPLLKAVLFQLPDADRLLLVIHHLAIDGVSWRILLEDLERGYTQYLKGDEIDFGDKTDSFQQWAQAIESFSRMDELRRERDYWNRTFQKKSLVLPIDNENENNEYGGVCAIPLHFTLEETRQILTEAHRAYHTEANDILLTALGRALQRWLGSGGVWIALEGHGREPLAAELDFSRTLGWFTSLYPFFLQTPGNEIGAQIKFVKETLREIPRKGASYGVLRYIASDEKRKALHSAPAARISFNYLGQFDNGDAESVFAFAEENTGAAINPFLKRPYELEFNGLAVNGCLEFSLLYQPKHVREETVERLISYFHEELLNVSAHCRDVQAGEKTPSDFTSRIFSLSEYEKFLSVHSWKAPEIEDIYCLSPMQEGLLFETLRRPDSRAYFLQVSYKLRGHLQAELFLRSWKELCRRHPILRTALIHEGLPRPIQIVFQQREPESHFQDLRHLSKKAQREAIEDYQRIDKQRGFDFQRESLMRIAIFQLSDDRFQAVWSYHHILLDGWCLGIIYRDLFQIYRGLIQGTPPSLPPAPPYSRYIRWLEERSQESARQYWANALAGCEQRTSIPRRNGGGKECAPGEYIFYIDKTESAQLQDLATRQGAALNAAMQILWAMLLSRYNDVDDVIFGAIVSGRPPDLPGVEETIGLFINAIPVRVRFSSGQSFADAICARQRDSVECEMHHYLPLADIQSFSSEGHDLFDHLLTFVNYPMEKEAIENAESFSGDFVVEEIEAYDRTHYDFNLIIVPGETIQVKFQYNSAVFPAEQIERMAEHFLTLTRHALKNPNAAVETIDILSQSERRQVLYDFQGVEMVSPCRQTVIDLFQEQAAKTPDAAAVIYGEAQWTYRQLNEKANRIAHHLRHAQGVQPNDRIGLLVDRSPWALAGILGVLKSGAAYAPIDPGLPPERIAYILQDSRCAAILSEEKHREKIAALVEAPFIDIRSIRNENVSDPSPAPSPQHLAYVIYTSGSTGQPKGCLLEHRNLIHYLNWANHYYFPDENGGHFGLFTALSIDLTITALFLPLIRGKSLYVFSQDAEVNDILRDNFDPDTNIDCVKLTPSHISLLKELGLTATNVSLAIVGGEALFADQAHYLHRLNPRMAIYNEYGPTETTVGCIVKKIAPQEERILIGQPIDNTQIYILDRHHRPVPIGVPGEIYIGGAGVARGYHNRPVLDAERFLPNPFRPNERLYKTGDLGGWLADGQIDYLGRNDDQVKIRGHRIELGEIERRLAQHEAMRRAAVISREIERRGTELIAYYVSSEKLNADELREHLQKTLPDPMIPSYFIQVDSIPLTPSGKIDKKALPLPIEDGSERTAIDAAPRNRWEERLARIWRDILQVETVGVHDNFFKLGGHSLKAMQMAARIQKVLGVKIPLPVLFQLSTIAQLAPRIQTAQTAVYAPIASAPPQEYYDLSHAQKRLWILHRMGAASNASYNMPKAFLFEGEMNAAALNRAFSVLIERHEALRTAFVEIEGEPQQKIHPAIEFKIQEYNLCAETNAESQARAIAEREAVLPFDLAQPPLLRAAIMKIGENRFVFLLVMHHIIGDGWSLTVLFQELLTLYAAFQRDETNPLPPLRIHYKDFAAWQNAQDFTALEHYWLDKLSGAPQRLRLPYDFAPEEERDFRGQTEILALDNAITQGLQALALKKNSTLSNVVFSLFNLFLFQISKQEEFCVGIAIANRNHPDTENLIGFFVNILPIRMRFSSEMEFDELLDQAIENTYEAFERQDYPFDLMIEKLNPGRIANRQPLLNVIYGFQNASDIRIDLGLPDSFQQENNFGANRLQPFDLSFETSKFDLTLFVYEERDRLHLALEYDSDLFKPETIRNYLSILDRFAAMIAPSHSAGDNVS
ncbi:MAG: amino acid adenylation domain-containing protein [Candidatus Omnitrophota bacterium]